MVNVAKLAPEPYCGGPAGAEGEPPSLDSFPSLRTAVARSHRTFDVNHLPLDLQRVVVDLTEKYDRAYALRVAFTIRTAVELHRGWHMTLLTSKIMQQLKDRFDLRLTWKLGVLRLEFRLDEGNHDLSRKVPYDYDSEFQDKYTRIAEALMAGHIDVERALQYQVEVKRGDHTACSGRFFRAPPGRLVIYPLLANTCCVIFFGGDWRDFWVTTVCGIVTGLIEVACDHAGPMGGMVKDTVVGTATGIIGGLAYQHFGGELCLASIFLGTLYWFFYGTAFVIGLLEIIAGELETGVTRFIAVSVKTFVLCLGASFGMVITFQDANARWDGSFAHCGRINLQQQWWRVPLYLACSLAALMQYRFPVVDYWRGLTVQLAAYEAQYQVFRHFAKNHARDNMDSATANVAGAVASVITACLLSYVVDNGFRRPYYNRMMGAGAAETAFDRFAANLVTSFTRIFHVCGLGRQTELRKLQLAEKLRDRVNDVLDPATSTTEVVFEEGEESALVEAIVGAQDLSVWATLMPAVYQLVPGSMIAKLWFSIIYPPELAVVEGSYVLQNNVFSDLMVTATSLALGLILGFVVVRGGASFLYWLCFCGCGPPCASPVAKSKVGNGDPVDVESDTTRPAMRRQDALGDLRAHFLTTRVVTRALAGFSPNDDPRDDPRVLDKEQ